jgi:hypothetical protein
MSGIEVKVPMEAMRERKLFVATPMYGGQCHGIFTRSCADLSAMCANYGIQLRFYYMFNESLITRARNYCVDEFLRSGDTHLMFIDSDIGFEAQDVLTLLALQDDESPYDVLAGPYPKKTISWEKIKQAVDKGFADDDPSVLERFVGDYVFNPLDNGQGHIPLGEPVRVSEAGTGFMMIKRSTFEPLDKAFPELSYKPDHIRTENFDGSREIMAYFDTVIDPQSKRYLSEDYMFCYNVQKVGLMVWLCPWMQLTHAGSYLFGGSLRDLAMIGATATADPAQLKKKTSKPGKKK